MSVQTEEPAVDIRTVDVTQFAIPDIAEHARTIAHGKTVVVFDTTLRDGEQSPGATLNELEALEIGELSSLSGPVFVRALASSVCRHLKMDPTEVLALLPQVVSVPFSQPPELKTPFRVQGESSGHSAASRFLTKPVL